MAGRVLGDTRRAVVAERVRGSRPGVQQRFTTPEIRDAEVRLIHLASANAGNAYVEAVALDGQLRELHIRVVEPSKG